MTEQVPNGGGPSTPAHDAQLLERTVFEVKRVIVGQDRLVERMLVGLLAKGHLLLEGVPGVAKTLAVETFAKVVGGSFSRVQFTPDLVPADILGTRIYRQGSETFDVELGPVVANFVLADEINRAPAKVQSAMLEVMAERHVSIGGKTFPMPEPVPGAGHPEPDRERGRLPAAGGPARPVPLQDHRRLPDGRGGARDRLPDGRDPAGAAAGAQPRRAGPPAGRRRPGCSCTTRWSTTWSGWCSPPGPRTSTACPTSAGWVSYGASPARQPRHRRGRAGAGPGARPRLRAAAGRPGRGAGRAAAPAGALLRRARRRRARSTTSSRRVLQTRAAAAGVRARRRARPAAADAGCPPVRTDAVPIRQPAASVLRQLDRGRPAARSVGRREPKHRTGPARARRRRSCAANGWRPALRTPRTDRAPQAGRPAAGQPPRPGARARHRSRGRPGPTSPATTCAGWTGRSPRAPPTAHPGDRRRPRAGDLARRRPLAQPRLRHRAVGEARPGGRARSPRSPTSPAAAATGSAPSSSNGAETYRVPARGGSRTRAALLRRIADTPRRAGRHRGATWPPIAGDAAPPAAPARAGRGRLRLPRPARTGSARCARSPVGTTCSASRSSTRARSTCPKSARSRSPTRRPAVSAR